MVGQFKTVNVRWVWETEKLWRYEVYAGLRHYVE
jgi:hypothetical protein